MGLQLKAVGEEARDTSSMQIFVPSSVLTALESKFWPYVTLGRQLTYTRLFPSLHKFLPKNPQTLQSYLKF